MTKADTYLVTQRPVESATSYYEKVLSGNRRVRVGSCSTSAGKGLHAAADIKEGDELFEERPLVGLHSLHSKDTVLACAHCLRWIGTIEGQLARKLLCEISQLDDEHHCEDLDPDRINELQKLSGTLDGPYVEGLIMGTQRLPLSQEFPLPAPVPCPGGCAKRYCSQQCAQAAWTEYHCLLCCGSRWGLLEEETPGGSNWGPGGLGSSRMDLELSPNGKRKLSEMECGARHKASKAEHFMESSSSRSPSVLQSSQAGPSSFALGGCSPSSIELVQGLEVDRQGLAEFVCHADASNEIFHLCGKALSYVMLKAWPHMSSGQMERSRADILSSAWFPFSLGCKKCWWDCVQVPEDVEDPEGFVEELRGIAAESLQLLRDALPGPSMMFPELFTLDVYGSIVGMFELNNLSIEVPSPLVGYRDRVRAAIRENGGADQGLARASQIVEALGESLEVPCEGTGFFAIHSCINHSCCPNSMVQFDPTGKAVFRALRNIAAGEEITMSYIDEEEPRERRQAALKDYGFKCECVKCTEEEVVC